MVKVDIPLTYSTIYTDPVKQDCKQKEVVQAGVPGKLIQIDQVALLMMVVKAGIIGKVWVTLQYSGIAETKIAEWTETKTTYQAKTFSPGVIIPDGLGITLRYYLTTSDKNYRSRMNGLSYTYSLVDVPVIVPEEPDIPPVVEIPADSPALICIKCSSNEAESIKTKIQEVFTDNEICIFERAV